MKLLRKFELILVGIFFFGLSLVLFRQYVFGGQVPLPTNLLISLYSPFKFEHWPQYPIGAPNKPIGFDIIRSYYPYLKFTIEEFKSGNIPLWDPYILSGNGHLSTYQSAVLYPLNFLFFILPQPDAWAIMVLIQPILGGVFTFLFLRMLMSFRASFFGALAFTMSGWAIVQWEETLVVEHSFLWLPLALYGCELLWSRNQIFRGLLTTFLALVMSIFAGYMQITIYVFLIVIGWSLYRYTSTSDSTRGTKIKRRE